MVNASCSTAAASSYLRWPTSTRERLLSVSRDDRMLVAQRLAAQDQGLPQLRFGGGIVAAAAGDQRQVVQGLDVFG